MDASPPGKTEQKVRQEALGIDSRLQRPGGLAFRAAFPQTALAAEEWQSG